MILADTNILSELARPAPNKNVLAWARSTPLPLAVSVVTVEEINLGLAYRPQRQIRDWFESFLTDSSQILEVTLAIAARAGAMRGRFRAAGEQRTQADMLIAATAQAHQLPVATRNLRDFAGCGIPLVNPFEG